MQADFELICLASCKHLFAVTRSRRGTQMGNPLARLSPEAARSPQALEQLEHKAMERVRKECPDVEWISSYAILGPCDYLDVFRAKDVEAASKVSTLIRTFGHAQTEIWTATEWDRFKEIVRAL